jgi:DNA-binding CsgD family transcriptional regulator
VIDRATELVPSSADLQFIAAIRLVRIETLWIAGDVECARKELRALQDHVELRGDTRHRATVNYWSWKCGDPPLVSQTRLTPFDLQIAGAGCLAADAWDALGFPFEAALARSEVCDEASLRQAICAFTALGAKPAATLVQRRLRDLGATSVPRGPQTRTLANPAHLTGREIDVLALVSRGQRNAEIASQLFISPKTVERHLSSIYLKLSVDNRAAAVSEAARLGISAFSEGAIARN